MSSSPDGMQSIPAKDGRREPCPLDGREKPPTLRKAAKPRFFYGYVVAAAGFVLWLVGFGTHTPAFSVLLKPVMTEFGWTRAETMVGYSLAMFIHGALAIVMGRLTDRIGPRLVVTVFGSFSGICYLLMSQVSTLWQFQLNYALVGAVGQSALTIPIMATVSRWFVKRRGLIIGVVQSGLGLGGLVFAPLTAWLTSTYGWRLSYAILGIVALAGVIIPGLFLKGNPREVGQLPDGTSELIAPRVEKRSQRLATGGLSLWEAIHSSQFWIIAGLFLSFGFCRSTFLPHTAAYVQDKGFSLTDGANVVAALTVSSIFGRIIMGRVADVIGNRPTLMISEALTTLALTLGLITSDLRGLYLYGIIFGFGWGAQAVLRFAVTSEAFGLVSVGVVMGVLGFAEAGSGSFGSYFAGYIFDTVGNYDPAFWLGIAISIIGIMLVPLKPAARKGEG